MARIDNLSNFLTDVANSIREKKGTTDTIQASDFDTEITNLPSGASKYAPRYISFNSYTGTDLTEEIANLDTSNMTSMKDMFRSCSKLTSLDLSNFNTNNITEVHSMFYNCFVLASLDLGNLNTSNVKDMTQMFYGCSSLTSLDVSMLSGEIVTNATSMFNNCSKLTSLDLSTFNAPNLKTATRMFSGCSGLTSLDIRNLDLNTVTAGFSNMFQNVPTGCLIIVKDDSSKTKITTQYTELTNVKTVAEL